MTWPPPPPESDPWATEPVPADDTAAGPPPEPPPEPVAEPIDQPIFEPEPEPVVAPEQHDPAPPIDAGIDAGQAVTPPPPPPPEGWSGYSHAPPPVVPRPQVAPPPSKKPIWLTAAAVAGILVVGLLVWLVLPSGGDDTAAPATTTDTPRLPTPTADAAAEARLLGMLPAGYRSGACETVAPPAGARAAARCGPNTDPGGPVSSTYTVAEDGGALDAAFNAVVNGSTRVNCPGNIQSPGPWRRNATPQQVSGVLFCGIQQNRPVVAWTNVDESLVVVAEAGPQGPNLDQLYLWWSSHS
ncbi:hypothetical protein [Mycolicibacterium sp. F2034L]|uniref:hypothetical protein n=1 Tax=Mycolicibacterium sp. F2034L TaxID=2926422 RepID=UPI001FF43DCE|nr:hypothetical protein [Mycolicibacterium sp. F2034L]MCK0176038.1 hypothetical protein [Mycolicibacterium sp. F2034L]